MEKKANAQSSYNNTVNNLSNPKLAIPSNIMIKSTYMAVDSKLNNPNYFKETIVGLYEYIYKDKNMNFDQLEIEAKFGRFIFTGPGVYAYEYINEMFKLPTFEKRDSNCRYEFKSGLDESIFFSIWSFVEKEAEKRNDIIKCEPKYFKETHYRSGKRKSFCQGENEGKEVVIKKEDKRHFNIRNAGKDFRITCCKEVDNYVTEEDEMSLTRDKFRVSYEFGFFRLDFTIVNSADIINGNTDFNYEIEFEFTGFKRLEFQTQFSEYTSFEYIFKRFFQNILCIYELTDTRFLAEYLNKTCENKFFGNIIGDYLEKNFDKSKFMQ